MAPPVTASQLARSGFLDTTRAARFLAAPTLAALDPAELAARCGDSAEPDLALLTLVRLGEAGFDLAALAGGDRERWKRLVRLIGASRWAGDQLVASPELVDSLDAIALDEPYQRTYERVAALIQPFAEAQDLAGGTAALRRYYRRELLGILAADLDLTAAEPQTAGTSDSPASAAMPMVGAAISQLVGASLDGALRLATALHPAAQQYPFAIVAMGKTGGEELNYISDVDVVYVCDGENEDAAVAATTPLATTILKVVSGAGGSEPPLWPLDANLRPEGKDGPLVRTLDSHLAYYRRWAKGWEFQALLKSRPVAGDLALGERYLAGTQPLVWAAAGRENFVEDAQAMRRRVEEQVARADRQLKLGKGGLRDVEFTVQLLQLVHGRTDESLRSRNTLATLAALAAGGYVGRNDAAELASNYRFLRALEHRIQFDRMQRSHLVPTRVEELRRLGRLMGVDDLEEAWTMAKRRVRELHEEIFYRPLLPLTARLSQDETSLEPAAATARLRAIGYRDPDGAMRHIASLTDGLSRRAAIQRQLLPVMIGWFANGPDPDAGLLEFRKLSDALGTTHWYLKLLRDSGMAAERLALILASSAYCAGELSRLPESVQWLAHDEELAPRDPVALRAELSAVLSRHHDHAERVSAVRYLRRRELTRAALSDVLRWVEPERAVAMTDAADIAVIGALEIAKSEIPGEPATFAAIAVGRMGGRELNYSSDIDLMFVYEPTGVGPDAEQAALEYASEVATALRGILTEPNSEPGLSVDIDLRPEGRAGPIVRSLASYAEYYERWSEPWEWQALLRARPVAGNAELAARFIELIDSVRYRPDGIDSTAQTNLKRIKARVESERMPRGVAPHRHLKLGGGGLTDVEFTAQFLQLLHAGAIATVRTTSTCDTLDALRVAGVLSDDDADDLIRAWRFASRIRDAIMLVTDKPTQSDVLPKPGRELSVVSRMLGYAPGESLVFEEDWLRAARRSRRVVESVFYGS